MAFTFTLSNSAFIYAQEFNETIDTVVYNVTDTIVSDTIYIESLDSITDAAFIKEDTPALKKSMTEVPAFKPNPKRAVMYSAIFPGLGQIYNKKYWKLPIVYGGFMGFAYAISWNNKTYQDYFTAYKDYNHDKGKDVIGNPDLWKKGWQSYTDPDKDQASYLSNTNFENTLKRGTDTYRRYRDLSIILAVAWYFLCMADAYVDAQLFDFDITPDLSMRVEPVVTPRTRYSPDLYGLNCCIKF
ncbi:MAG: DUF5683 domain-containing protein [Tannerella sp.]|jgi:hypothetical protein|nr:DUF5683 domain-containing protein [Tannerella sp.]